MRVSEQQLAKSLRDVKYLRDVQENRYIIEQAKGMLMAQSAEMSGDAFEILVQASQRENVKVRDIAHRVVDRRPVSEAEAHGLAKQPGRRGSEVIQASD